MSAREPLRHVESRAAVLARNDIDTDQIIPARFLKGLTRDGLGPQCFADWRYEADGSPKADFPLNQPGIARRAILVSGHNFGCGSSREHAVWALMASGFRVVIASSFADIFRNNALKNGLLPIAVEPERLEAIHDVLRREPDAPLAVDVASGTLSVPGLPETHFEIDPFARRLLLDGADELDYLLAQSAAIEAYEARRGTRSASSG